MLSMLKELPQKAVGAFWMELLGQFADHKKINGLFIMDGIKIQSVVGPNRLIVIVGRPYEGKKHDSSMIVDFNLLARLNNHSYISHGEPFCIYGDPDYPLRVYL